ncbi:MAG: hypothetical protein GEU94_12090 [Micromonosporaceae bacterium]|nr:hypothetical protein [Micromonosporaceae bacterium]
MTDASLIMYDANHRFGIGVTKVNANSSVVLHELSTSGEGDDFTRWILQEKTGHLVLKAKTPDHITLALDVREVKGRTQLCVKEYDQDSSTQKWIWSRKPLIVPSTEDTLCVDNYEQTQVDGNKIWLFPKNGTPAQNWKIVRVAAFADATSARDRTVFR